MKRENVLASLWISIVTAFASAGFNLYMMFVSISSLGGTVDLMDLIQFIGYLIVSVLGLAIFVISLIALIKSRNNEKYFANNKKFLIVILVVQAILVLGSMLTSVYTLTILSGLGMEELIFIGSIYSTSVLVFAGYTASFVLHLVSMIKAKKAIKVEE